MTLRGLRREVRERRRIWEKYQRDYEQSDTDAGRAVVDMARSRADELEWAERLIRDFALRVQGQSE